MVLGIFDPLKEWWFNFLYSISRTLLRIIDYISQACNKISGVEDISVAGQDENFLIYVLRSNKVLNAVAIASVIGTMLLIIFSVIAIIRTMYKANSEDTPLSVAKKSFKNLMLLICVPMFMLIFVYLTNAIVQAMYQATQVGNTSLAQYMFYIFSEQAAKDAGVDANVFYSGELMYSASCDDIRSYFNLNDFEFIYSWIIGGIVVYLLLTTSMMLVERVISIALLFIVSPFAVASAVLDDGGRFKQWRDQILAKFLTGHGAIIAINIYLMIVSLVMQSDVVFFENGLINSFVKLLFCAGGALSLKSVQAVIGNLVTPGAGDKAVAENDRATHGMARAIAGVGHAVTAPFRLARAGYNFSQDAGRYGALATLGNRLGFKTERDYHMPDWTTGNKNDNMPRSSGENMVNNAIAGGAGNDAVNNAIGGSGGNNNNNNDNTNNNQSKGNQAVNNIIGQNANPLEGKSGDNTQK